MGETETDRTCIKDLKAIGMPKNRQGSKRIHRTEDHLVFKT